MEPPTNGGACLGGSEGVILFGIVLEISNSLLCSTNVALISSRSYRHTLNAIETFVVPDKTSCSYSMTLLHLWRRLFRIAYCHNP